MARRQIPQQISLTGVSTTPAQISTTTVYTTSFMLQAPATNADYLLVGNAAGQLFQLSPGREVEIKGDELDNGTCAYLDLSEWYVKAASGTLTANVTYLERF